MMKYILLAFLIVGFSRCASVPVKAPGSITFMTYNVENLFDNEDDPGKEDETYLPRSMKKKARYRAKCAGLRKSHWRKQCLDMDWSTAKIEKKMKRLADVILQEGSGPDILVLEEVENIKVLTRLNDTYLKKAGYTEVILIEGPDKRGIDVAMLSRLPQVKKAKLHEIDLSTKEQKKKGEKAYPTRGILEATFKLPGGKPLTVFGVHFPSQGSPTPAREKAVARLNGLVQKMPKDAYVMAAGDFNITMKEDGVAGLYSEKLAKNWLISHLEGCDSCEGTHSYRGDWSFLDAILFSKNMKFDKSWRPSAKPSESWAADFKSLRVANKSIYQINHWGSPARFSDGKSQVGVSDHWPLAVELVPVKEVK